MHRLTPSGAESVAAGAVAAQGEFGSAALVLERVSDAFVALDRDWRYTYVNERAGQIFGRRPTDLVGKHIWTEFPEGVGQPFHRAYERAMATQQFTYIEAYYPPYDRWFENRIYPAPDGVSIFFHDITERKREEILLLGQNRLLEGIAGGAPLNESLDALVMLLEAQCPSMRGSILLLDPDGVHLRHGAAPNLPEDYRRAIDGEPIGPAAGSCGTAAFRRETVIVEDIASDPLWSDYRELALKHGLRACWSTPIKDATGRVLGTFAMYYAAPGKPAVWQQRIIEVATHVAALAISRERAERERAQTEQLLNIRNAELEMKNEFVAGMSHELRAPLNAIIGAADLLLDQASGPLNSRQIGYLNDVVGSARHLLRLIEDVLAASEPEVGKPRTA
jgi:PAS domain S-box-containing protein